ncbi:MAG: hypothetical protein EP297_10300, partial [Gammaproteobacteria bacterium]
MRREFKPSTTRPEDFSAFWHSTRIQLEQINPEIERRPHVSEGLPGISAEIVSFLSLGHVRVSAYFLQWQDEQPRPLVINSHGYGGHCWPRWEWA